MVKESNPQPNIDELKKKITDLEQINGDLTKFTFGITNILDETGRQLVKSGNSLFTISDRLKAVVKQANDKNV